MLQFRYMFKSSPDMSALPVLDYVVDAPPASRALEVFADPQGVSIDHFRVFLSARIYNGATLLIIAEEDL